MYGTSPEMMKNLYVQESLKNQGEGFVFQVKNTIESGSVAGITRVAVDGEERSLEGATIQMGDRVRPIAEVSWSAPLYVSYGAVLTIYVPGKLAPGEHTVNAQFNVLSWAGLACPSRLPCPDWARADAAASRRLALTRPGAISNPVECGRHPHAG